MAHTRKITFLLLAITGTAIGQDYSSKCPTISVASPAGIVSPGDPIEFTAKVEGSVPKGIVYQWTASRGTIVSGQGTMSIKVSSEKWKDPTTEATFSVSGLPEGCPSVAAERYVVAIHWATFLPDEYPPLSKSSERRRLDKLDLDALIEGPFRLYVVFGSKKPGADPQTLKRARALKKYFVETRKVPADRVFFGMRRTNDVVTKIYFVPFSDTPPWDVEKLQIDLPNLR